jgi:hypothetical protein
MSAAMQNPASACTTPRHAATPGTREPRVFNRRSRMAFVRDQTAALVAHLNREPTYPERILITRIAMTEWQQRRLEARMDAGEELSGHAQRAYNAAGNRLRLDLKALGLQAAQGAVDPMAAIRQYEAEQAAAQRAKTVTAPAIAAQAPTAPNAPQQAAAA